MNGIGKATDLHELEIGFGEDVNERLAHDRVGNQNLE